jgi:membrane peptidoglycan carboxypeptidase
MVGSRNFFDIENDGNYNIATAHRQPGSSFKPIVYATAFNEGYTPDTVVFDLPTQFNVNCSPEGIPGSDSANNNNCYMPVNYDGLFVGPISLRNALAQSRNIPALKVLYLAGIDNALNTAKLLGITTLKDKNQYGLTLVLGGGEVSLLELTGAYSVFANDGIRNSVVGILRVEDNKGNVLEEYKPDNSQVIPANTARLISDVLSDVKAKIPAYGVTSPLFFPGRQVADKTGTTNDYRDTWTIGYTPSIAVGAWVGNNDNTPMEKKVAGMIVSPMWNAFMQQALQQLPNETFIKPAPTPSNLKPVLRGIWSGGETYLVDKTTGQTVNNTTNPDNTIEKVKVNVHSILYWLNKKDPNGPAPSNPYNDEQFRLWEYPIQKWAAANGYTTGQTVNSLKTTDNSSNPTPTISATSSQTLNTEPIKNLTIISPDQKQIYSRDNPIITRVLIDSKNPVTRVDYYVNSNYIGSSKNSPFDFIIKADDLSPNSGLNELKVLAYNSDNSKKEQVIQFKVQ